jgi:hypothetical protein
LLGLSCKKEKGQTSNPLSCRIITALGGPDTYHFTYNPDGKVSSVLSLPLKQKYTYTYEGDTTKVLYEINGNFESRLIITNNPLGFTTNVLREQNKTGTIWYNQSAEYNGTQIVKMLYTSSEPNGANLAVNYTWKDGNIASMESGGKVITYEYYTDRESEAGDWRRNNEIVEGYRFFGNKNLTKSIKNNSGVTRIDYEFDTDGKITKQTVIEPDNLETYLQYEYACN